MKHIYSTLSALLSLVAVAAVFTSCNNDEVEDYFPSSAYFTADREIVLNGTSESTLAIDATGAWTIAIDPSTPAAAEWLQMSQTAGADKAEVAVYSATFNPSTDEERVGQLIIRSTTGGIAQVVKVRQYKGSETFTVGTEPDLVVDNKAQTITVPVHCNTSWTASGGQSWCRLNAKSGTKDDTAVTIDIDANESELNRTAKFIFVSEQYGEVVLTIVQVATAIDKEVKYCIVTTTEADMSRYGGTFTINVLANTHWMLSSSHSWARTDINEGEENATVRVTVDENEEVESRMAELTFHYAVDSEMQTEVVRILQAPGVAPDKWDNPIPDL